MRARVLAFALMASVISVSGTHTMTVSANRSPQTATPSVPQFTLLSVAVHKKPRVGDPRSPSFYTVRVNRMIYLYIYYFVQAAPDDTRVTTIFSVTRGHTLFAYHRYVHGLLASPPSGGTERVGLKLQTPGKYSFSGYVKIGGHVETGRVAFRVRR